MSVISNEKKNILAIFFTLGIFLLYSLSSLSLEVKSNEYLNKSIDLNLGEKLLDPPRGNFYDKNGSPLTQNIKVYSIKINKAELNTTKLANLVNFVTTNKLDKVSDNGKLTSLLMDKTKNTVQIINLNESQANKFNETYKKENFFEISYSWTRKYLYPLQTSHLIGYVGKATVEDLKNGYKPDDYVGKYKLEEKYEDELKGTKGKQYYIGDVKVVQNPEPGDDVHLTIDINWQLLLYKLLQDNSNLNFAAGGGVVVVDNSNGNIMAIASYPGIDTNLLVNGIDSKTYSTYLNDRNNPLSDKSIGVADAPGSIFKAITAYDLLQNNVIDVNSTFLSQGCLDLGGGYQFCEFGHEQFGYENVERALYKSSNMFFCNFTLQQYRNGDFDSLVKSANLFNIGSLTQVDIPGESKGNMDSPEYRKDYLNLSWFDGDTCNTAIGQGAVLVTPVQMAMVASTITNHGTYLQPHVLKDVQDIYNNVVLQTDKQVQKQIPVTDETLRLINSGMSQVANNPEGTVYYFLNNLPGNIRAKTGTAEAYENVDGQQVYRTHGWIIGTFDYNNKSYSFAFHLRYGGGGFYIGEMLKQFVTCVYSNFQPGCSN